MKLSAETIEKIKQEYNAWVKVQYGSNDLKSRQALGQFYTPPELTVKMLEKFENLDGNILDPTCGAGGLLAAAVIAGANPRNVFGIELDTEIVKLCRERLARLGVPRWNIHQGDALVEKSYEFNTDHQNEDYLYLDIKDLGLSKIEIDLELVTNKLKKTKVMIDFTSNESEIKSQIEKIWLLFSKTSDNYSTAGINLDKKLLLMNKLFKKYLKKTFEVSEEKKIKIDCLN